MFLTTCSLLSQHPLWPRLSSESLKSHLLDVCYKFLLCTVCFPLNEDAVFGASLLHVNTHMQVAEVMSCQPLSSEDTCWVEVEQHVEPPRPGWNIVSQTRTRTRGLKTNTKKDFFNRKIVLICWFTNSLCLMQSVFLHLRLLNWWFHGDCLHKGCTVFTINSDYFLASSFIVLSKKCHI